MALDRRLTRVQYSGDVDAAKGQLFGGMLVLNGVREQLRLSQVDLKTYQMVRRFADGTIIQAVSSYGHEQINIFVPPKIPVVTPVVEEEIVVVFGFICHPRSDLFPGGRTPKGDQITPVYSDPLVDNDHGSVVLTPSWTLSTDVENYGNIDWVKFQTQVVSWRGPSGRSFPMDSLVPHPGFVTFDYETGDPPITHYTPFQNLVYQGGKVYATFPAGTKVVGSNGKYTILGVDYAGVPNPDLGVGGFYTEVWQGLTTRLGFLHDSRPSVPWFFNQLGLSAVSAGKKLDILVADNGTATTAFSVLPGGSGAETKTITPGASWGLSRTGNFLDYYDYVGNILTNINILVSTADSSVLTGSGSTSFGTFPIMYSGVQATSLLITGPDNYGGPGAYTATLQPPGSGDCGGDTVWSYPSGCGMGTVSATKNGISGSMQVRMETGRWGDVTEIYNDPAAGTQDNIMVIVSGGTQTTYVQGSVQNIHTWSTDGYVPFQGDCNNCVFVAGTIFNVETGTGLDYTFAVPSYTNGTPATCCDPGGIGQGGLTYYTRTLRIYTQPWVC